MSTLTATTLEDRASSDQTTMLNAIHGSAKAWVNFNGTGTVSINDSYNVDSITDQGGGSYVVNFSTPFANANYSAIGSGGNPSSIQGIIIDMTKTTPNTTTQCLIAAILHSGSVVDTPKVFAAFFGDQ